MSEAWYTDSIPFITDLADDPHLVDSEDDRSSATGDADDQPDSEDDQQTPIIDGDQHPDIEADQPLPDIANDNQQVNTEQEHQQSPTSEGLDTNDAVNVNRVQAPEVRNHQSITPESLFAELMIVRHDIELVARHIVSVPREDIRELYEDVKSRFAKLEKMYNIHYGGSGGSDKKNTSDPNIHISTHMPVEPDANPDLHNVCTNLLSIIA